MQELPFEGDKIIIPVLLYAYLEIFYLQVLQRHHSSFRRFSKYGAKVWDYSVALSIKCHTMKLLFYFLIDQRKVKI